MISVLMSIFERERPDFLEKSLQSLVDQTYPADQLVLVWDGFVPKELTNVVDRFRDKMEICDVKLERNQGLGAALHAGLSQCAHDLVARMDTDDIALPHRFDLQRTAFINNPSLDVVSGYAIEIDADGISGRLRTVPIEHDTIVQVLWANPIIHPAVMFKRESILFAGSYNPVLRRRQDYELWFRCAAAGLKFGNVPEPLIEYRFTPETHKRQSRRDMWQQGVIGFKGSRAIDLPLWKQLACFAPFARSLLPMSMQHHAYRIMHKIDPRRV